MSWSWAVFFVSLVVCSVVVMFARGAMNSSNVAQYGARGDYRSEPGAAIVGSILAGAVFAAIITVIIGAFG
ncbi:RsiW-degrading membrane proteinase PrsW (M82 family) [Bradyrhizobium liaoningense]